MASALEDLAANMTELRKEIRILARQVRVQAWNGDRCKTCGGMLVATLIHSDEQPAGGYCPDCNTVEHGGTRSSAGTPGPIRAGG